MSDKISVRLSYLEVPSALIDYCYATKIFDDDTYNKIKTEKYRYSIKFDEVGNATINLLSSDTVSEIEDEFKSEKV